MGTACTELAENWFGDDQFWSYPRALSSLELFLNAKFYTNHQYVQEKSRHFATESTAFSAIISDAALGKEYDRANPCSRIEVFKHEVCRNLAHSLLIDLYVCIILIYW